MSLLSRTYICLPCVDGFFFFNAPVDLFDKLFRPRTFFQNFDIRVVIVFDADLIRDAFEQSQHLGVLLLGQQVNLQIEVVAPLADSCLPVLGNQNERRKNNRFRGNDGSGGVRPLPGSRCARRQKSKKPRQSSGLL